MNKHMAPTKNLAALIAPNRGGRPKKEINVEPGKLVFEMANIGCTNLEIATALDVSDTTLKNRFGNILTKGRENGKMRLRFWQWKAAERGNITMLIWLGKQILGQNDKVVPLEMADNQLKKINIVVTNPANHKVYGLQQKQIQTNKNE